MSNKNVRSTLSSLLLPLVGKRKDHRNIKASVKMETVKEKKRKAGRPEKAIKKEVRACIRFSKVEYFVVRQKASKAGLTASAYIRQIAIKGRSHAQA